MITIRLYGGLGNQLFGYALGRSLGQQEEVQFDPGGYARDGKRHYSLSEVGLNLPLGNGQGRMISEKSLNFDSDILNTTGDAALFGYWQSEKYFERAADRIRSEVFVAMKTSQKATRIAETIDQNTAFVHVRRGDYLLEPHKSFHGNLSLDYYKDAMMLLRTRNADIKFLVFSDDPSWCKENFPDCTIAEGTNEFEDLWLMAQCQHAVIANSSFSWWGAWLGPDQRGVVIAPEHWFENAEAQKQSHDLVPQRWVHLAN